MSIAQTKKDLDRPQKRSSINKNLTPSMSLNISLISMDQGERMKKEEQRKAELKEKVKRCMQDTANGIKEFKYQPFDLREIEANHALLASNHKFASLLQSLQLYNKKLLEKRENDIVNYRLHQFYYSTLQICNTKTDSQVQFYLREVQGWYTLYNHRRELVIHPNKKQGKVAEDQLVRQTFKSNLPLEIERYQRKICVLSSHKCKKSVGESGSKLNSTLGMYKKYGDSSDDDDYIQRLIDKRDDKENRKEELELPNLRAYRMQAMRVRQAIENRHQAQIFKNLKKNQSRIITQSSNNFYKPLKNRNDIFNKSSRLLGFESTRRHLQEAESSNNTKRDPIEVQAEAEEDSIYNQNHRVIVNSTSMGFHEIKKNNINKTLGLKKGIGTVNFPKFFVHTDGYFNQDFHKNQAADTWQGTPLDHTHSPQLQNISGLSLLRNPFQITKPKKEKKSK